MRTLNLPPKIETRLNKLSRKTGRSIEQIAVDAILLHLADIEDRCLALERGHNPQPVAWPDAIKTLGLSKEQIDAAENP
jgi:hypothetical protein